MYYEAPWITNRRLAISAFIALFLNVLFLSIVGGYWNQWGNRAGLTPHAIAHVVRVYTPPTAPSPSQRGTGAASASHVPGATGAGSTGSSGNAIVVTGAGGRLNLRPDVPGASAGELHALPSAPLAGLTQPKEIDIDPSKTKIYVPAAPPLPSQLSPAPVVALPAPPMPIFTPQPAAKPKKLPAPSPKQSSTTPSPEKGSDTATAPRLGDVAMPGAATAASAGSAGTADGTGLSAGTGESGDNSGSGAGTGDGIDMGTGSGSGKHGDARGAFGVGKFSGDGAPARHVVYVVDVSISMGEPVDGTRTRLDRARSEVLEAIKGLGDDEEFDVVLFGGSSSSLSDHLLDSSSDNVDKAESFLRHATLREGTNIGDALDAALSIKDVNVVVLITDGVPTVGEQDWNKIVRSVKRANQSGARIDTVGLVGKDPDGVDQSFEGARLLRALAADNGGVYRTVGIGTAEKP